MRRVLSLLTAALWAVSAWQLFVIGSRIYQGTAGDYPIIGKVLRPEAGDERWLPLALLVTFGIVLVDVGFQYFGLITESKDAQAFGAVQKINEVSGLKLSANSIARRRLSLILSYGGLQPAGLHDALPGASGLDEADVDTRFAHTRALIWALPVMGFIGTALGLAKAIAGFSEALNVSDTTIVVKSLGQTVIPGLSGAFSVTMLALAASTVGHLCVTALSAAYHSVLKLIDDSCLRLLAQVPRGLNSANAQQAGELSELKAVLRQLMELLHGLDPHKSSEELAKGAAKLSGSADSLNQAADVIKQAMEQPYFITVRRTPEGGSPGTGRR